ncbi:hypothetical protein AVEN_275018-1 [Araneus ventricosus]|uniref:RNase H type-1 domain-containing protein n=1 Tax=Araneus ventricosus TaxID=182803 RepID=A0A4Y2VC20_ARAVE|nr:hypothetical protein AVEN_275018-1 [Araneus ventricosus]
MRADNIHQISPSNFSARRQNISKNAIPSSTRSQYLHGRLKDRRQNRQRLLFHRRRKRNTNGCRNLVPSTQSSKQSFLLYRRLVFGQARPINRLRAHVGYSCNEAADVLAKKATQEGIPTYIPAPRNHIKNLLQKESSIRWQKEWDNVETGRGVHNVLPKVKTTPIPLQRPDIMFVTCHCPFLTYLKRFIIRSTDSCGFGNLENPLHYGTTCLQRMFTTSYHLTKPSADLEPLWWKRAMNNNNSRAKIRKLIHFIEENETLLFPKDGDN